MKMKLIIATLLVCILAAGVWSSLEVFSTNETDPSKQRAAFLKGGDFKMTRDGGAFQLSDLKGQVVLLYFGFTSCPDVCPTGLSVIKSAMNILGDQAKEVKVVFITLDPGYDNEERLREYLSFFDKDFIGLSGTADELRSVAKQYGVYYKKVDSESSSLGYTVDHSAHFFIIDKTGELAYVLAHNVDSQTLAEVARKAR